MGWILAPATHFTRAATGALTKYKSVHAIPILKTSQIILISLSEMPEYEKCLQGLKSPATYLHKLSLFTPLSLGLLPNAPHVHKEENCENPYAALYLACYGLPSTYWYLLCFFKSLLVDLFPINTDYHLFIKLHSFFSTYLLLCILSDTQWCFYSS